jgi:hypothetical protein
MDSLSLISIHLVEEEKVLRELRVIGYILSQDTSV